MKKIRRHGLIVIFRSQILLILLLVGMIPLVIPLLDYGYPFAHDRFFPRAFLPTVIMMVCLGYSILAKRRDEGSEDGCLSNNKATVFRPRGNSFDGSSRGEQS